MYINNLNSQEEFHTLWRSDSLFVIFKYSPRCPLCLDKMGDLYKWMSTSKVENIYQLDVVAHPELKVYIADILDIQHKTPQIIMIQHQKSLAVWDETDIDIPTLTSKLMEVMLG